MQRNDSSTRGVWTPVSIAGLAAVVLLSGCMKQRTGFDAPGPNKRLDAIVGARGAGEPEKIRRLIGQLESTDPAARMLAIRVLEDTTGQTMGYRYYDPHWKRIIGVNKWKVFLEEQAVDQADDGVGQDTHQEAMTDDHARTRLSQAG